MGAELFSDSWGLSFFRFLGAEFFQPKKNTAHHLHLLVQGHGSVFFLVHLLINTKKKKEKQKKQTQPII